MGWQDHQPGPRGQLRRETSIIRYSAFICGRVSATDVCARVSDAMASPKGLVRASDELAKGSISSKRYGEAPTTAADPVSSRASGGTNLLEETIVKTLIRASIAVAMLATSLSFVPGVERARAATATASCTDGPPTSWSQNDGRVGTTLHEIAPCPYQTSEDTYYVQGGPLTNDYLEAITYENGQATADVIQYQIHSTSTGYHNFTCGGAGTTISGEGKQVYASSGGVLDDVVIPNQSGQCFV